MKSVSAQKRHERNARAIKSSKIQYLRAGLIRHLESTNEKTSSNEKWTEDLNAGIVFDTVFLRWPLELSRSSRKFYSFNYNASLILFLIA